MQGLIKPLSRKEGLLRWNYSWSFHLRWERKLNISIHGKRLFYSSFLPWGCQITSFSNEKFIIFNNIILILFTCTWIFCFLYINWMRQLLFAYLYSNFFCDDWLFNHCISSKHWLIILGTQIIFYLFWNSMCETWWCHEPASQYHPLQIISYCSFSFCTSCLVRTTDWKLGANIDGWSNF